MVTRLAHLSHVGKRPPAGSRGLEPPASWRRSENGDVSSLIGAADLTDLWPLTRLFEWSIRVVVTRCGLLTIYSCDRLHTQSFDGEQLRRLDHLTAEVRLGSPDGL